MAKAQLNAMQIAELSRIGNTIVDVTNAHVAQHLMMRFTRLTGLNGDERAREIETLCGDLPLMLGACKGGPSDLFGLLTKQIEPEFPDYSSPAAWLPFVSHPQMYSRIPHRTAQATAWLPFRCAVSLVFVAKPNLRHSARHEGLCKLFTELGLTTTDPNTDYGKFIRWCKGPRFR